MATFTPIASHSWAFDHRNNTQGFNKALKFPSLLFPSSTSRHKKMIPDNTIPTAQKLLPRPLLAHFPVQFEHILGKFYREWHLSHSNTLLTLPLAFSSVSLKWDIDKDSDKFTIVIMGVQVFILVNIIQQLFRAKSIEMMGEKNDEKNKDKNNPENCIIPISLWEIMVLALPILQPVTILIILHAITRFPHKSINSNPWPTFLEIYNLDLKNQNNQNNQNNQKTTLLIDPNSQSNSILTLKTIFNFSPIFKTENNIGITSIKPIQPQINPNMKGNLYQIYQFYEKLNSFEFPPSQYPAFPTEISRHFILPNFSTAQKSPPPPPSSPTPPPQTPLYHPYLDNTCYNSFIEHIYPQIDEILSISSHFSPQTTQIPSPRPSAPLLLNSNDITSSTIDLNRIDAIRMAYRKIAVRAYMMKVMKREKTLKWSELHHYMVEYLHSDDFQGKYGQTVGYNELGLVRGVGNTAAGQEGEWEEINEIKDCLEYLLNEYMMERDNNDRGVLHYL
jgi:hypothetical protein